MEPRYLGCYEENGIAQTGSNVLDAAALAEVLTKRWRVRDWMAEYAIKELFLRIRKLPAIPRLHDQVTQELQSPQPGQRPKHNWLPPRASPHLRSLRRTGPIVWAMRIKPRSVGWTPSTVASPSSPSRWSAGR